MTIPQTGLKKGDTADLLLGVKAIAAFIEQSERQAYHLIRVGRIPTFKIGTKQIAARRSAIVEQLNRFEQGAA